MQGEVTHFAKEAIYCLPLQIDNCKEIVPKEIHNWQNQIDK